jgi:hypothetical protein
MIDQHEPWGNPPAAGQTDHQTIAERVGNAGPHQPDNGADGDRRACSEGAPDASASVAGQHGEADGDLRQTNDALEGDIPGWGIGGQDTG